MGGPSISGGGSIGSSGSREAGIAADRNSVSGYSGSGGSITAAGSRAAGVAADRNSVSGYSGSGLYSSAGQTPTFREAEIASMAAYDRMRTTDLAAQHRAAENMSMADMWSYANIANYKATDTLEQQTARAVIQAGIRETAMALGIDPVDLATAISYETKGTFSPTVLGPTTQWGQHKGLIQFGEPQAIEKGIDWNAPAQTQLGPNGAIAGYLRDAGVTPGTNFRDIYSAINAGSVGRYKASDAKNGGMPGTVQDKVDSKEMAAHRAQAESFMAGLSAPYGGNSKSQPASQVANIGATLPNKTSAIPTTRSSFGAKYLGDTDLVTERGFFPGTSDAVPTSRPSPVASAFTGRPDVPVGAMPAARMGTTVAGRPDVPVGSLPAARAATTIAGRPDVPVGALPAARDIPASTFPARPAGPAAGLPAARFESKYLSPVGDGMVSAPAPARGPVGDGLASGPVGSSVANGTSFAGGPAPSLDAAPVGAVERGPSLAAPSPSIDRSVAPANPGELGGIAMSNPTGLGGPGGLYVGGQPTSQDDRIAKGRADETAYSAFEANRAAGFSQIADRPKSTSQQIGEGLFGDEDTYVDDETVPIADLPEHPSAPRPSAPVGPAATPSKKETDDSIAEVVVAGGLDILGGMVPVFGTGLSVVNAGLAITGRQTIGQRIADYIFDGEFDHGNQGVSRRAERGGGTEWFKSERFIGKYLRAEPEEPETQVGSGWVETTGRPTPKERYIDARDTYAG